MAYNSLEEQELNEIKSWWKENYKTIIAAAVLGISGVSGWNFWQSYQADKAQQLSMQYEQIMASQDEASKNSQLDTFVKENGKTAYAALALLDKAKQAISKQDYEQAEASLKEALAQSPDQIFTAITAIRLAEVQLQRQQFESALNSLALVKDATWESRKALINGEIKLAQGDKQAAKQSFEAVLNSGSALERQQAQVRLNNL